MRTGGHLLAIALSLLLLAGGCRAARAADEEKKEDWQVRFSDDFQGDKLNPEWKVLTGNWKVVNGTLRAEHGGEIVRTIDVTWNNKWIEFDATVPQGRIMAAFYGGRADEPRPVFSLQLAARPGTGSLVWNAEVGAAAPVAVGVEPGKTFHVGLKLDAGLLQAFLDGQVIAEHQCLYDLDRGSWAGIAASDGAVIDNVQVRWKRTGAFQVNGEAVRRARPKSIAPAKSDAPWFNPDSPTCGMQEYLDALPKEGGVLVIPPGRYVMRRSLKLRDNVEVRGYGPATVLEAAPPFRTLLQKGAKGDPRITVQDASGFEVGMGLAVLSVKWWGDSMHHYITAIEGNVITLDSALEAEPDIGQPHTWIRGEGLWNAYPMVWGEKVRNVVVRDLTIRGPEETPTGGGFVLAGVHEHDCEGMLLAGIAVRRWPTDAFSIQGGNDIIVKDCYTDRTQFHPGTSLGAAVFINNITHGGWYWCWYNHYLVVTNSLITDGGNGMWGYGAAGDQYNVVAHNVMANNEGYGISTRGEGRDNIIYGNVVTRNCTGSKRYTIGIDLGGAQNYVAVGNLSGDNRAQPWQKSAIAEYGGDKKPVKNVVAFNLAYGGEKEDLLQGKDSDSVIGDNLGRLGVETPKEEKEPKK